MMWWGPGFCIISISFKSSNTQERGVATPSAHTLCFNFNVKSEPSIENLGWPRKEECPLELWGTF